MDSLRVDVSFEVNSSEAAVLTVEDSSIDATVGINVTTLANVSAINMNMRNKITFFCFISGRSEDPTANHSTRYPAFILVNFVCLTHRQVVYSSSALSRTLFDSSV